MTRLLEEVFRIASKLSEADQDALAAAILDGLTADARWDGRLTESITSLSKLAEEAREDYRAARTEPLDPDRLRRVAI